MNLLLNYKFFEKSANKGYKAVTKKAKKVLFSLLQEISCRQCRLR